MEYTVKAFGITKDILGGREAVVRADRATVASLRQALLRDYPQLAGLKSLLIAVNNVYADDGVELAERDIALIPPVSGG